MAPAAKTGAMRKNMQKRCKKALAIFCKSVFIAIFAPDFRCERRSAFFEEYRSKSLNFFYRKILEVKKYFIPLHPETGRNADVAQLARAADL